MERLNEQSQIASFRLQIKEIIRDPSKDPHFPDIKSVEYLEEADREIWERFLEHQYKGEKGTLTLAELKTLFDEFEAYRQQVRENVQKENSDRNHTRWYFCMWLANKISGLYVFVIDEYKNNRKSA